MITDSPGTIADPSRPDPTTGATSFRREELPQGNQPARDASPCSGPFMPAPGFVDLYGPLACEQHGTACSSCEVRDSWADHGPAEVVRLRADLARLWHAVDAALGDYPDTETVRQQAAHHALVDAWAALRDAAAGGAL